jgi:hypothetical protein
MSPVGGPGARRLRGARGLIILEVVCYCGTPYIVSETARDIAQCPNKRCRKPTRDIPTRT